MRTDGISFIIYNWNHELVLPGSVGSGLRAGDELRGHGLQVEVLVVDDASRDGSPVLLRQLEALYYERGVRALTLQQHTGRSAARNLALKHAGYRYVVFLEADNEVIPENLIYFYRSLRETEAALVFGYVLVQGQDGVNFHGQESVQARLFAFNYIDSFALVDAEQLLDAGGFWNDPRNVCEDWELFLHLAATGRRLVHVPMVFGRDYRSPAARGASADPLMQRIYRSLPEVREAAPLATRHLRYHPAVGYLHSA